MADTNDFEVNLPAVLDLREKLVATREALTMQAKAEAIDPNSRSLQFTRASLEKRERELIEELAGLGASPEALDEETFRRLMKKGGWRELPNGDWAIDALRPPGI
jgi:hypothetical protein